MNGLSAAFVAALLAQAPPAGSPPPAAETPPAESPPTDSSTVKPAETDTGEAPAAPTDPKIALAEKRLSRLIADGGKLLEGRPTTLRELLKGANTRNTQFRIVTAYWRLAAVQGKLAAAAEENARLATAATDENAGPTAKALAAGSAARRISLRAEAELAQRQLAGTASQIGDAALPVAVDVPLVVAYRTKFDVLFAQRPAPAKLRRIAKTLPKFHDAALAHAEALSAAEDAAARLLGGKRPAEADLAELSKSLALRREQQSQFLDAVVRYNGLIAEYALSVVAEGASVDTILSTLIRLPATAERPADASPGAVRPAGALEPIPAEVIIRPPSNVPRRLTPAAPRPAPPPKQPDTGFRAVDEPPKQPAAKEPATKRPAVDDSAAKSDEARDAYGTVSVLKRKR